MKSAIFYGRRDVRIERWNKPSVGQEDVLIQVRACGVCGTDVLIFDGGKGEAEVQPPAILGHEFAGVVAETGSAVTGYRVGDRVCIDPNRPCGGCAFCREGMPHYCDRLACYGTTLPGGFAEYCSVHQNQVYRLGDNTSFAQGAMAEPVACCLHGLDRCNIRPGSNVVVIGGGMIGMIMLQLARLAGAARVALLEPVAGKRQVGRQLGADVCIDPLNQDVPAVLKASGLGWVNTVIECAGRPSTMQQAIQLAGPQATVLLFGLTKPEETVEIQPFELFQKEIELKSSFINPHTHRRALALIDAGRINVSSMVCEVCGLDRLPAILIDPQERRKGKFIIDPTL